LFCKDLLLDERPRGPRRWHGLTLLKSHAAWLVCGKILQNRSVRNAVTGRFPSLMCTRDERMVKFFSASPGLIRKNWIRSSPDP